MSKLVVLRTTCDEYEDGARIFFEERLRAAPHERLKRMVRKEDADGTKEYYEGDKGVERLVRTEFPFRSGRKDYYEGDAGEERLVRVEFADGQKRFYEGAKGVESLVREELRNGQTQLYCGAKGEERLVLHSGFADGQRQSADGQRESSTTSPRAKTTWTKSGSKRGVPRHVAIR